MRRLVLRIAFVGSAACGVVLSAGAAAHADLPNPTTVVSAAVDTAALSTNVAGSANDVVTTAAGTADATTNNATTGTVPATESTVDETAATLTSTVDDATDAVTKTVDDATDAVTETVGEATGALTGTLGGVTETVTKVVDDLTHDVTKTTDVPAHPVKAVLDLSAAATSDSTDAGIPVRAGSAGPAAGAGSTGRSLVHRLRLARTVVGSSSFRASTSADRLSTSAELADATASSARRPGPAPLHGASPPSPVEPLAIGFALALIGVIALRSPSAPPRGWQRRLLRTTAFDGAAIALAVERPG